MVGYLSLVLIVRDVKEEDPRIWVNVRVVKHNHDIVLQKSKIQDRVIIAKLAYYPPMVNPVYSMDH